MERSHIQANAQTTAQQHTQDDIQIATQTTEVNQKLVTEVDDILAEIDGILEENAEDFVKGFVQKGGQ